MKNIKGINNPNYRTGYKVKGFKSSLYNSWQGMKSRCFCKMRLAFSSLVMEYLENL